MKKLLYILGMCNIFLDVNCMSHPLERSTQEQGNSSQAKYLLCPFDPITTGPITEENTLLKPPATLPLLGKRITAFLRNWNASIQTVSDRYHWIQQTFKPLLNSRKQNIKVILTSCKECDQQAFEVLFGIRKAVEQLLSYYRSSISLVASSKKVQFGLSYVPFRLKVETFIKQLFQMPCKCNYKNQLEHLTNELADSFYSSGNDFENLPDLMGELMKFQSSLSTSMNTLQRLGGGERSSSVWKSNGR